MQRFSITPTQIFVSLWRNRELIQASAQREVLSRYRGSFIGLLWSFLQPLLMLAVFTFVFSVIFQARWGGSSSSKTEFALVLFAGLIIFNLFTECVNRAPSLVISNVNYVKKVVFPLEILPFISLLSALFQALVSVVVWLIAYALLFGKPPLTVLYLPLVLLPLCLLILGLSWALAALGVFLRDISQVIGPLTTALMFISPVFYPSTAFPEDFRYILYFNPLTIAVEQTRDVLFWAKAPDMLHLAIYYGVSAGTAWLGFVFFQKTRKGFADVL